MIEDKFAPPSYVYQPQRERGSRIVIFIEAIIAIAIVLAGMFALGIAMVIYQAFFTP